jgi:hypothetical protein
MQKKGTTPFNSIPFASLSGLQLKGVLFIFHKYLLVRFHPLHLIQRQFFRH